MVRGVTMVRAFLAVPIEPAVLDDLAAMQSRLRSRAEHAGWKASWNRPVNMHITLKFFGDIDAARVHPIVEALAPLAERPPFDVTFRGVGAFPPVGRPKVLWAGVEEGERDLRAIHQRTESILETIGFSRDRRPFRSHLTLARVKHARPPFEPVLDPLRELDAGRTHVREVVLYKSELKPDRAEHTPLARISLQHLPSSAR